MKAITYRIVWQTYDGGTRIKCITVEARMINSGFRKAVTAALQMFATGGGELVSVEFWSIS